MNVINSPHIFVITGAESTGKTVLTEQLANHFKAPFYPEFARKYVLGLTRKYTFSDIELIAKKQVEDYNEAMARHTHIVFFDTWLIITKVWFETVYQKVPDWIDSHLQSAKITGFILNDVDLPWIPDPVRENGGENRVKLHHRYEEELLKNHFCYTLNTGTGDIRLNNAIDFVRKCIGQF